MDYSSFGLAGPPFSLQPNGDAVFMSATHCEVFAALQWGLGDPDGFVLVVGEPGTGKTTMLAKLLRDEHPTLRPIYVNPPSSMREILSMIALQIGLRQTVASIGDLTQGIRHYLEVSNSRVGLILDEAQAFPDEMLEELRLFANSPLGRKGRVKLIFVGHPQLRERLAKPALNALNQRIVTRAELTGLNKAEIPAYIDYRLRLFGCSVERLFTGRALRRVVRSVRPIPREINTLCQNALVLSYAVSRTQIDVTAVDAALSERRTSRQYQRVLTWLQGQTDYVRRSIKVAGIVALCASASAFFLSRTSYEVSRSALAGQATAHKRVHEQRERSPRPRKIAMPGRKTTFATTANASTKVTSTVQTASPAASSVNDIPVAQAISASDETLASNDSELGGNGTAGQAKTVDASTAAHGTTGAVGQAILIRKGDTLTQISLNHLGHFDKMTLGEILLVNPQLSNPNVIYPGQTIQLPVMEK